MSDADEKVLRLIEHYARKRAIDWHLRDCADLLIEHPDAGDGMCGFGTCEIVVLEAELSCPHGHHESFDYEFGGALQDLLEEID